jgi:hypothetical protein
MTVELESAEDPLQGSLDDGRGPPIEFAGWLELMSALDKARERAAADSRAAEEARK